MSFFENLPFLKLENHPLLEVNGFHTGVGFKTKHSQFYIDYVAKEGIGGAFLPTLTDTGEIQWHNEGINTYGDIDSTYWTHSTYIGTINKTTFLKYVDLIFSEYQPNNSAYVLFEVAKSKSLHDIYNPYLRGQICDNFCFWTFNTLSKKFNMKVEYISHPMQTIAALLSDNPPIPLDINNPKDKEVITQFYYMLSGNFKNGINDLINIIKNGLTNPEKIISNLSKIIEKNYLLTRNLAGFAYNNLLKQGLSIVLYTYGPD